MKRRLFLAALVVTATRPHRVRAVFCPSQVCPPASFFVDPNGSDSNPGTLARPFQSVTKGVNSCAAGQGVQVNAGTYTENVIVTSAGTATKPISVCANGPVTIQGTGAVAGSNLTGAVLQPSNWNGDDSGDPTASGNQYITWNGFTITTPTAIPNAVGAARCSTGWAFTNCTIKNIGFGMNVRGQNVSFTGCRWTNIEGTNAHAWVGAGGDGVTAPKLKGLLCLNSQWDHVNLQNLTNAGNSAVHKVLGSTGAVIQGCTVFNVFGTGIWFDGSTPPNDTMTIRHCTLHDCRDYGVQLESNPTSNAIIDHCTFYNDGNTNASGQTGGIGINETQNVTISNCAFVGPNGAASGNIQDTSWRNGSHPTVVSAITYTGNYFNGNGFPCIADDTDPNYTTPAGASSTMDNDFFGPNVNQYMQFGGHTSATLADVRSTFSQEAHGSNVTSQPPGTGA